MERENDNFFLTGIAKVKSQNCASVLFALNCIIPGSGTILSAFMDTAGTGVNSRSILFGIFQLLLSVIYMLGWFWSIYHGFLIYTHAADAEENFGELEQDLTESIEEQQEYRLQA